MQPFLPIPGRRYLMPYLVPYGGVSWTLSCLLPPSSISLFASILLKLEVRHSSNLLSTQ